MENEEGPFFYVNSVVKPNGVIAVFEAYFMKSTQFTKLRGEYGHRSYGLRKGDEDVEMEQESDRHVKTEIKSYNERGFIKNLVIVKQFSIEIFSIEGTDFKSV
jgi:uncharacterized protein (UPF0332 family)